MLKYAVIVKYAPAYLRFPFIFVVVVWQGKLKECVPLFKKAITIWEKTRSPKVATGFNGLAQVLQDQVL